MNTKASVSDSTQLLDEERSLGKFLRDAREVQKWSQHKLVNELSELTPLSGPRISDFEHGKARPSIRQLAALVDVLKLDLRVALLTRLRDEVLEELYPREPNVKLGG